jgi:hypothetical protein
VEARKNKGNEERTKENKRKLTLTNSTGRGSFASAVIALSVFYCAE